MAADSATGGRRSSKVARLVEAYDLEVGFGDRLEHNGVDVEELRADFASYQAIRSYLTEYRDAEYAGTDDTDRIADGMETIQRLRSRLRAVADTTLSQLRRSGRVTLGEFRLFGDVGVFCEDCETRYGVVDLLERGGCNCDGGEG